MLPFELLEHQHGLRTRVTRQRRVLPQLSQSGRRERRVGVSVVSASRAPHLSQSQPAQTSADQHGCSRLSAHILGVTSPRARGACAWPALVYGVPRPSSLCHGDRRSTVLGRPQHRRPRGAIGRTRGGGRRRGALEASLGRERLCTCEHRLPVCVHRLGAPLRLPPSAGRRAAASQRPTKRARRRDGRSVAQWPVRARRIHTMAYTPTRDTSAHHEHYTHRTTSIYVHTDLHPKRDQAILGGCSHDGSSGGLAVPSPYTRSLPSAGTKTSAAPSMQ